MIIKCATIATILFFNYLTAPDDQPLAAELAAQKSVVRTDPDWQPDIPDYVEIGEASWYGGNKDNFAGKTTASGWKMNPKAMTAAHRTLPFGTRIRVTNIKTGKAVTVTVNDRGPYKSSRYHVADGVRIIDVSEIAAKYLGFHKSGTAMVMIQRLSVPSPEEVAEMPNPRK